MRQSWSLIHPRSWNATIFGWVIGDLIKGMKTPMPAEEQPSPKISQASTSRSMNHHTGND